MPRSESRALVYLAAALFSSFWLFLSQTLPVWLEEVSVYPAPATAILAQPSAEDPVPRFETTCAEPGPVRVLSSATRPQASVCFQSRQYPLQITSYASGIPYWISDLFWPLHRGLIFRVRAAGLLLGLLNILMAHRLLVRFASRSAADITALCLAATPAFVVVQSMLVHFEVLPWLACAAAVDQLSRCRTLRPDSAHDPSAPPTARVVAAAAFVGLALLSNVKALFLIAPLVLMALRAGVRFGTLRLPQWILAFVIIAVVVLPGLAGNAADSGAGFAGQVRERIQILASQLDPTYVVAELPNVAQFWGDTLLFMAIASGDQRPPLLPGMLVTIAPLLYCLYSGVAFLYRGRGAPVAAACGLMTLMFMVVSGLLYVGIPKGNYGPLYAVFGIAMGVTANDGAQWLSSRVKWRADNVRLVVIAVTIGALAWNLVGRGSPTRFTTMSINAAAVRALGAYLTTHPDADATTIVTTYNLTGVPEAVTGGLARTLKAASHFEGCPAARNQGEPTPEVMESARACVRVRFERLLQAFPGPVRFVVPLRAAPVDDALAGEYRELLEAAAKSRVRTFREEQTFSGSGTGPLLGLFRVDAAGER